MEEVKAVIKGAVDEGLGEIGVIPANGRISVCFSVSEAEVPFADHARSVSVVAKKLGKRGAFALDKRVTMNTKENPAFKMSAPAIAPCEKSISTRSTAT